MPDDEEQKKLLEKLKAQQQLLEIETSVLNAEKARLESSIALSKLTDPKQATLDAAKANKELAETLVDTYRKLLPQTTALAGTVTVDQNVKLESQILAYRELAGIAQTLAEKIRTDCKDSSFVICGEQEIDALLAYRQFTTQLDLLEHDYKSLDPGEKKRDATTDADFAPFFAGIPALPIIAAASAAFDALGLLRENVATTGVEVVLSDFAIVALVADQLRSKTVSVVYPGLVPVGDVAESVLLMRHSELADLRRKVHERLAALDPKDPNVAARIALRSKLDDAYAALIGSLTATGADKKTSTLLALLLRAESLQTQLGADARLLFVRGVAAGGTNRATQSLLPWRSRLSHSGGAIVGFVVVDKDGKVLSSGVAAGHSGYQHQPDELAWSPKSLAETGAGVRGRMPADRDPGLAQRDLGVRDRQTEPQRVDPKEPKTPDQRSDS